MRNLILDYSVVIRPAYKGSGIVILDARDDESSLKKLLEDCSTYSEIDRDVTKDTCKKVNKLLRSLRNDGIITKELEQYMAV